MIWDGCGLSIAIPPNYEEQESHWTPEKTCFKQYWLINFILSVTVLFLLSSFLEWFVEHGCCPLLDLGSISFLLLLFCAEH